MAITLDELLGRNTARNSTQTVERFPTYEDYLSSRRDEAQNTNDSFDEPRFNFETRPYTSPRSEESVRRLESSRPYVAPTSREYINRDFDGSSVLDRIQSRPKTTRRETSYENNGALGGGYGAYAQPQSEVYSQNRGYAEQPSRTAEDYRLSNGYGASDGRSLYQFTANDFDRLSDNELFEKLSHTNGGRRPLFDRVSAGSASAAVGSVQAGSFASARETLAQKTEKKRAKLNTKGKIILAAYIAVIVTVAVLIIVNAGSINKGTAKVPSSSLNGASVSQSID
jgi:hypothetical protein